MTDESNGQNKQRKNGTTTNNYKSTNRPVNRTGLDATAENKLEIK